MRNPIRNGVVSISRRDLVSCKRCGCQDLAWVRYKSGKQALVKTANTRPLWKGESPAPEGLYALKFNYHRCADYLASVKEKAVAQRISDFDPPYPGFVSAGRTLGNALAYLFVSNQSEFTDTDSHISRAATILAEAACR